MNEFRPLPKLDDSARRLAALDRFDILDTPREEGFERIARLIKNIFGVQVAAISMIDGHRQWFKALEGLSIGEADRNSVLCLQTMQTKSPIVVADASLDSRFLTNPYVAGEPHIRFYAGVPLRTEDGHTIGTVCAMDFRPRVFTAKDTEILVDLAKIAMSELELRQRATTDALTGIMSRRAFKEEGARAILLALRHKHAISCIVFDLDFFKLVNDTYGHAAGDQVLVDVTAACETRLRKSDLLGRLGGEEFAVLLPHTTLKQAMKVAENLRSAISNLQIDFQSSPIRVTASFGVAVSDIATTDIEGLLANADIALLEAKRSGRNKCVQWNSVAGTVETSARRRVLKAGSIIFNNRNSMIDCTIRSLSEAGAGIDVITSLGIPEKFSLAFKAEDFEEECKVISHTDRHFEVEFVH